MVELKSVIILIAPVLVAYAMISLMVKLNVAYLDENLIPKFDKIETLKNSDEGKVKCERLEYGTDGSIPGEAEDIAVYDDGLVIVVSGPLKNCFEHGNKKVKAKSAIYIFDAKENIFVPAEFENKFKLTLAPHGTYFSKQTNRLYIINHIGTKTQSTIVVFELKKRSDSRYPIFNFLKSVKLGIPYGTINDLVELSASELFVTQWRKTPLPNKGLKGRISLYEKFLELSNTLSYMTPLLANSGFYYCRFDLKSDDDSEQGCILVNRDFNFLMANGITIDRSSSTLYNTLYVNDLGLSAIQVYETPKTFQGISLKQRNAIINQVKFNRTILTVENVDNIDYHPNRRTITAAGIPFLYQYLQHSVDEKTEVHGSFIEINVDTDVSVRKMHHDGSSLKAVATCVYPFSEDLTQVICGSPLDAALLRCHL